MKILVLNCGSSSIKYQLFNMADQLVLAKGVVEKIGMQGSFLKHEKESGDKVKFEGEILDHKIGIEYVLGVLTSQKHGCITGLEEIEAVGHRVVHGGEAFKGSVFINDEVIQEMENCVELAPLHNPPNLKGIYAMQALLPDVPQVGVFDTAFHQTMPQHAYMYGIPYALYTKYGIRRYGFHGTSHRYVARRAAEILGLDQENSKIISCHLGNGASVCAVKNGESVDTSMGFTPVEGLIMGTRSGDIDLGAVTFIMDKEKIGTKSASTLFNKHAGMLGISGVSSDARDIEIAALENGNERAQLAMKMYDYRIRKYIGSYAAAMGGVDALVFTGGIGENADITRAGVCEDLEFLGIELDEDLNNGLRGKEQLISKEGSKVKVVVVPTNEELMIAIDTETIVKNQ
ncbi:acetate kinase [Prolixibacter bellariivorans]|uniref:Acetate kinase n=1 Tax=Prolixibacter bellariivorans TaxID=314319 RepID=A0A5M4B467_9BACT|nr:acetate kinase [Prolixibacter bellariivorans]GET34942.1 acetate kinase [Prolixibacter bellariivorans]